jgi:hypothetical protein
MRYNKIKKAENITGDFKTFVVDLLSKLYVCPSVKNIAVNHGDIFAEEFWVILILLFS